MYLYIIEFIERVLERDKMRGLLDKYNNTGARLANRFIIWN